MKTSATVLCAALAAFVGIPAALGAPGASADPPSGVPTETFFGNLEMNKPELSPDGDALAILVRNKAGRNQLAILDTSDLHKAQFAAGFQDGDVASVRWVDDKRLVFSSWHQSDSAANQRGSGLYAVDRDGGNLRQLILPTYDDAPMATGTHITSRTLTPDYTLLRTLRDGSGDVIVSHWTHGEAVGIPGHYHYEFTGSSPARLDTRTGRLSNLFPGKVPDHVFDWVMDDKGQALAAITQDAGQSALMVPDGQDGWKERIRFAVYQGDDKSFEFDQVGADGQVYVTRTVPGPQSYRGLYRLDLATGRPDNQPIVAIDGFDYDDSAIGSHGYQGALVEDTGKHRVLGVHYVSDAAGTVWFDADMRALQAKVDKRLPGLVNVIDAASCGCSRRVLVTSYSDRQPDMFFLYDGASDALVQIGTSRPKITAAQMAATDFVRIKARDGQDLPIYVTKPHGKGPWPTVVLVHGGPQVRGWQWEWDSESQFLAARGYLVVKPEFRGSDGYGYKHFRAGFRQWGLAMQDDIADATRWAATQGLADPQRTCIAGASYGGYATLMGLIRYPELYRCGVAWSAVADIGLMYDIWWSDMDDEWKGYGMPVLIGDKVKDAAQFDATSPLKQAARITRPLLLAHGGVDRRVPIEQATQLRDALLANRAPVTWVSYSTEAHGWYQPEHRVDFYDRMAAFLAANIGTGTPASSPTATDQASH